jgi:hypothetical protein
MALALGLPAFSKLQIEVGVRRDKIAFGSMELCATARAVTGMDSLDLTRSCEDTFVPRDRIVPLLFGVVTVFASVVVFESGRSWGAETSLPL